MHFGKFCLRSGRPSRRCQVGFQARLCELTAVMNATKRFLLIVTLILLALPLSAENSVRRISYFSDPYGNTGSFWLVHYEGKKLGVFKIKSPDRDKEADYVLTEADQAEFESRVAQLKRTSNNLKADGFQVLWTATYGDATVKTLLGRLNGVKVKLIQVTQKKTDEPEREHQISIDECYYDFTAALQKFKRALP